jgi:chromosome partitioning protein
MKIVSLVTQKGGSSKSTLARHIAVAAHLDGRKVVVMDCDMQGTLRDWGETRASAEGANKPEPHVVVELSPNRKHIESRIVKLREEGVDLLVMDTPGGLQTPVPFIAAELSDLVLVPVRPTPEDLNAFWTLLPRLKASKVPMAVVLSQCPTTTPRPRVDTQAVLLADGVRVAPIAIHEKGIVPASGVEGLTALELEPASNAERKTVQEFQDLYAWVATELA